MPPRLFVPPPLHADQVCALPPATVRHVQVLRLQPGDVITLFDGSGGEWLACIEHMGRSTVEVRVTEHIDISRELGFEVTLALGMPTNDRMDSVVEKATELGVAAVQPLLCERSVLRLSGERADKKVAHWQAVATAASEQCGRTRVPLVQPVRSLPAWLAALPANAAGRRHLLSLRDGAPRIAPAPPAERLLFLSGPEGGLSEAEEHAAMQAGFEPTSLGARVLRADTVPLAVMAVLAVLGEPR